MKWLGIVMTFVSIFICNSHWFPRTPNALFFRLHFRSLQVTRVMNCKTDVLRCSGRFPGRAVCRLVFYREAGAAWIMPAGKVGSFHYCRCHPAWRGYVCQEALNPCNRVSCSTGQRCFRNPHTPVGFSCRCPMGTGHVSSTSDNCLPFARSVRLVAAGTCRDHPCGGNWPCREDATAPAGYTCGCDQKPGYRPASDTDPTCVLADPCLAHKPCHHGGTCLELGAGDFRCQCPAAWTGHSCQIPQNPCDGAELCGSGWNCQRDAHARVGYSCGCHEKPGWKPHSEEDPQCIINNVCAARTPCLHGGTCSPGPADGFTCQCTVAWDGETCDKPRDPCSVGNPCGKTWKCQRDPKSSAGFVCNCDSRSGWTATSLEDPRCVVGDQCQADDPCKNGGTCQYLSPGAFSCQCPPAWTGRTCEAPRDPCGGAETCGVGWPCSRDPLSVVGYTCGCSQRPGWRAVSSKDPTCILVEHCKAKTPCSNGGTCVTTLEDGVAGFKCECPPAWAGQMCTSPHNPCASADASCGTGWSCRRDPGSKVGFSCGCSKRQGWRAKSLDDPRCVQGDLCRVRRPCKNGGSCGPGSRSEPYTCRCTGAWQGPLCQKPRDPCKLGAPCGELDRCVRNVAARVGYTCHCELRPGYRPHSLRDPRCVLNDACRAFAPCLHGGTCSPLGRGKQGFTCLCPPAWTGKACELPQNPCVQERDLVAKVCGGGKNVCVRDPTSYAGFDCDCESRPGWRRRSSEDASCVVQDACLALRPCRHGATCRNVADPASNFYRCFCHPAWKGNNCTEPRDPCKDPRNTCNVGFRCRRDVDSHLGYGCGCDEKSGYRPSSPSNPECEAYDTCLATEPCSNGGECFPVGEKHFFCECKKSWTGKTCDVVLEPCEGMKNPCGSRWRCHLDKQQTLGYTCGCNTKPGWTASSIDGHCVVADPCLAYAPCLNGGSCSALRGNQYTCSCRPGWGGATCEAPLDPCTEDEPCGARFSCRRDVQSATGFSCDCESQPGYRRTSDDDPRCQLYDTCLADPPCLNSGRCLSLGGGNFSCVCPPGWRGRVCEYSVTTPFVNVTLPPPPVMIPDDEGTPSEPDSAEEDEPTPLLQPPRQFRPVPAATPALDGFKRFLDELAVVAPKLKLIFVPLGLLICSIVLLLLCLLCWRRICRSSCRRDSDSDYECKKAKLDRKCEKYLRAKYGCDPAAAQYPPCQPQLPPCDPYYPAADPYGEYAGDPYYNQYDPPGPAEEAYWGHGADPYRASPEYVPGSGTGRAASPR